MICHHSKTLHTKTKSLRVRISLSSRLNRSRRLRLPKRILCKERQVLRSPVSRCKLQLLEKRLRLWSLQPNSSNRKLLKLLLQMLIMLHQQKDQPLPKVRAMLEQKYLHCKSR
jgi:hypothetical protein